MAPPTKTYRLVIVEPSVAPFVPLQTADPTAHFYVTSKRLVSHPWIATVPDGEGQEVDPITGHTSDGDYTIRVIDVPDPAGVGGCVLGQPHTLIDFTSGDYASHGVTIDGTPPYGTWPTNYPHAWWEAHPFWFSGSVLFGWVDDNGPPAVIGAGPFVRESYIQFTVGGFQPGERVGFRMNADWSLDTGPGNMFMEVNGSRTSFPNGTFDFWTIDLSLGPNVQSHFAAGNADGSGNVTFKIGGELYSPSSNVHFELYDIEIVTCLPTGGGLSNPARYVTGWLADADARQQLLDREAFIEQSDDGGTTWAPLFTGYVTGIELQDSLTYDITVGDSRRIERIQPALTDIDPINEPAFEHMTALIGGPIYNGFEPIQIDIGLPLFRIISQQAATSTESGWVRLNYITGTLPPYALQHLGAFEVINERAQAYFVDEPNNVPTSGRGTYPGLRATLFDASTRAPEVENLTPLGQTNLVLGAGKFKYDLTVGQFLVNNGLEIVLQWEETSTGTYPNGTYFYLLVTPRAPSDDFPLYYRGHPVDLEAALLERKGVSVDTSSQSAVKALLGDNLALAYEMADGSATIEDIVEPLHGVLGYSTRLKADGEREFFIYRKTIDAAPAAVIDTDELIAEGGPTFELDPDSKVNRVTFAEKFWRRYTNVKDIELPPSVLETFDASHAFDYSTDGGATLDADVYGEKSADFELTGHLAWESHVTGSDYKRIEPMNMVQFGRGLARTIFDRAGRGWPTARFIGRTTADIDACVIGTDVIIAVDHAPNAQLGQTPTSQRGGTRWARVTQRDDIDGGAEIQIVDESTGVAYGDTVTLAVSPSLEDPQHFYDLEVSNSSQLHTDRALLEVEVGLGATPPTRGVAYTVFDGLEMVDSSLAPLDPWTVRIGPFPSQETVWVRARGKLWGGAPGAWSSWYTVGGSHTPGGPGAGLSNLQITAITDDGAVLTRDNTDATNQVRVRYRIVGAGSYTTFSTIAIGSTTETLTGLTAGTAYDVQVVLWDGAADVGTPLQGYFSTLSGAISGLTLGTPTADGVLATWTNSDTTYRVHVQLKRDTVSAYSSYRVLPPGSTQINITGLAPSTNYDIRVVLIDNSGAEIGAALTDSFTTAAVSVGLQPPEREAVFGGVDPITGLPSPGTYGLRVYADPANPSGHLIVFEEAVETAPGSATPGSYSIVASVPANASNTPTYYINQAPNDDRLRYLRAFSRAAGYTDSSATTALSVDPWPDAPVTPPLSDLDLDDLLDVTVPTPSNLDLLQFRSASGEWENRALDDLGMVIDDLDDVDTTTAAPNTGDVLTWDGTDWVPQAPGIGAVVSLPFLIDGGGLVITTGVKGDLEVPFDCTITGWTLLGDQSGSITIDTWKDTYANYPPVVADTMWGTKPALSTATKNQATGLSITVTAGDTIRYNVDSATTVTRVTLQFTATRT